ncbi:MAG: 2-oxoglutarate dehydrogenase complex dihydrolipoyllysine-residue succinyltransferase [Apibacter sp.]|nr:2-oxoglutarate dehydrogenase complex dihydrolipoyllysine-residue succinyltransferase [Apibacter sp.]
MIFEMKIPSPGESITEVEISTWLVKDGDYVVKDQTIAEIDSDKATLDLPAEASGKIILKAQEGDTIQVGHIICLIDTDAVNTINDNINTLQNEKERVTHSKDSENCKELPSDSYAKGTCSPAARKIVKEKNISPADIQGTGKDGRITKNDALQAVPSLGNSTGNGVRTYQSVKLSALRRKIAERLVSVTNQTAMLTTFNEVDMSEIYRIRNQYKEEFKNKHNVGLGFMSFFTLAVVRALQLFPDVNSMIDGDNKVTYDFQDISIAVSSTKGLMVPVLRNAETMTFRGVEQNIKNLADKVRDGRITVDEMTGGTFTITNGGVFGSMLSTPIINPPQSAILGMHNIIERPVVKNKQIVIAPMMYIALSYDHRIIDGKESVSFLVAVKDALEDPLERLMNNNINKALEL